MATLYKKYHEQGFTVLAVNVKDEDAKTVRRFAKQYDVPYPLLLDGHRLRKDWGVRGIPANFFVDRDGKMVKEFGSFDDRNADHVDDAIQKLLR